MSYYKNMLKSETPQTQFLWKVNTWGEIVVYLLDDSGEPIGFACSEAEELVESLATTIGKVVGEVTPGAWGYDYKTWEDVLSALNNEKKSSKRNDAESIYYGLVRTFDFDSMPIKRRTHSGRDWVMAIQYSERHGY